jgi:hypothetical protein
MDPNATLREIISAFRAGEWEECREACENLKAWLRKGGFSPGNFERRDVAGFCQVIGHLAKAQIERES